jgi:tellurite resistance protein
MGNPAPVVALSATPERIATAVHKVVTADGVRAARLAAGASQSLVDDPTDVDSARWFQSLVELGWLVASADGFDPAERTAMATLLATCTGKAVDEKLLDQHLGELAEQVDIMGRSQRLARAAAELADQSAGDDALAFAALVAMADGRLEQIELDTLIAIGSYLSIDTARVRTLVDTLAKDVEANL